ncbi:MAG: efflux RND transporter periplasmic adaptor subunit [Halioglobus sp.]
MAITRKQTLTSIAMLAAAAAATALLYVNRPPSDIAEPEYAPVTVDVLEVVKGNLQVPVQAQGTVTPLRSTSIQAEVRGRIVEVADAFNVGQFVTRGEVLLRIDPRDYQTSLLRAQAALESAESNLAQEKGRAEVALREWQKLPRGSQRSEEARDLYLRKPQLEQAESALLAARADLDTARDNLERTIIRAPYDALIRAKHSELGQFVAPGAPLADIFSIDYAEVRLPIPQSKLAYLDLPGIEGYAGDTRVDLYTDVAGDVTHWTAQLHRTEGVFDERSRVLYLVARIEDPYGLDHPGREPLRIGTFVNANIEGRELQQVVTLPRYALRAGNLVWIVDDSLHLRSRKVTTLRVGGDRVFVSAGLDDGELVSLTALDSAFAGASVKIQSRVRSDQLDTPGQPGNEPAALPPAATAASSASVAAGQ